MPQLTKAGREQGLHKALAATGKQGQHGKHSSQTPGAAFEEVFLFSCLSPPMSLVQPTALPKGHVTSKLFFFILLPLADSRCKPSIWAGAGQTGLVSSKSFLPLPPAWSTEGVATAHPCDSEQKHLTGPHFRCVVRDVYFF